MEGRGSGSACATWYDRTLQLRSASLRGRGCGKRGYGEGEKETHGSKLGGYLMWSASRAVRRDVRDRDY